MGIPLALVIELIQDFAVPVIKRTKFAPIADELRDAMIIAERLPDADGADKLTKYLDLSVLAAQGFNDMKGVEVFDPEEVRAEGKKIADATIGAVNLIRDAKIATALAGVETPATPVDPVH